MNDSLTSICNDESKKRGEAGMYQTIINGHWWLCIDVQNVCVPLSVVRCQNRKEPVKAGSGRRMRMNGN